MMIKLRKGGMKAISCVMIGEWNQSKDCNNASKIQGTTVKDRPMFPPPLSPLIYICLHTSLES